MNPGTLCTASAPGAISLAPVSLLCCLLSQAPSQSSRALECYSRGKGPEQSREGSAERAVAGHAQGLCHPPRVLLTMGHSSSLAVADPGQLEPSPDFTVSCCMSVTAGNLGGDHGRQALAGVGAGVGTGLAPAVHRSSGQRPGSRVCSACSEPALAELCRKRGFSQTPRWVAGSVGFCVHLVF